MGNYALLFAPADVSHDLTDMQSLYRRCESVRRRFDSISTIAGRSVDELLLIKEPSTPISQMELISLSLAAGMLGISDEIQREHGDPACAGGISLGELVAFAASGSISLRDIVEIIKLRQDLPQDMSHEEAVGFVVLSPEQDITYYTSTNLVSVAVDYGPIQNGAARLVMLSGTKKALEDLESGGPGSLEILPQSLCKAAHHSRHRWWVRNNLDRTLDLDRFESPRFPIISCLDNCALLMDKISVRDGIFRSETESLSLENLKRGFLASDLKIIRAIGPFFRSIRVNFGVPVTFYDKIWALDKNLNWNGLP